MGKRDKIPYYVIARALLGTCSKSFNGASCNYSYSGAFQDSGIEGSSGSELP